MPNALRQRSKSGEQGFTLIELLVVICIIGILAAIALPTFLGQRQKGQDSATKSDLRNGVSQVESCFTTTEDYTAPECVDAVTASGIQNVHMTPTSPTAGYVLVKLSTSGTTFSLKRDPGAEDERTCTVTGAHKGGCSSEGTW